MVEEWRLIIDFSDHAGAGRLLEGGGQACEMLRSRFGDDIAISAGEKRIFLYTGRGAVAREAELATRQVLTQHNLSADFQLDLWDPSLQVWRDAQSGEAEQETAPVAADAVSPGRRFWSWEMVEAISTVIADGLGGTLRLPDSGREKPQQEGWSRRSSDLGLTSA
jgi:hypothetical protein